MIDIDHIQDHAVREALIECREQIIKNKVFIEEAETSLIAARNKIAMLTADNERLEADNKIKTVDLRRLRDEIDPDKFEARVAERVAAATVGLSTQVTDLRTTIATLDTLVRELRASKRKLREALERLKDGSSGV